MSKREGTAAPGIEVRHARSCASRAGGNCNCQPTYQAHVFDAQSGRRIRRTFKTKSAAKLWRQDAVVALRRGELSAVTPTGRTVAIALGELVAGMRDGTILDRSGRPYRPATIRKYEGDADRYLVPALGHLRLSEVRRRQVQAVVDRLRVDGFSGSTIRNKLDPLRVVYRRAMQDDEVTANPTERLRLPALDAKPRTIAAPNGVQELLDALPETERAAWAVAFYGGLRVGELRAQPSTPAGTGSSTSVGLERPL